jgi:predicted Fe-Mo cluster-binding NifX family protein
MLIAITSDGQDLNSQLAKKFGKSPFIILYETENNSFQSFPNPYVNIFGGAEIQTAQFIIEKNVAAVITSELESNAFHFLKTAGIKIYYCSKEKIIDIVNKFNDRKLQIIKDGYIEKISKKGGERERRRYRKSNF